MKPTKLSELLPFLKSHNIRPKRSLSQNFLVDQNIVNKIIATLEIKGDETVIEIGPGVGALTYTLLQQCSALSVIEKDKQLATLLPQILQSEKLTVYNEDILEFNFDEILTGNNKTKVISNLPYHISSPTLQKLAENKNFFSSIILMVEKDYATRIIGKPNTKNYSSLTVFTSYHFKKEVLFHVSPNCFYPKPSIYSSIIKLTPIPSQLSKATETAFFAFVQQIFQKKRKMLRNSIKHQNLEAILKKIGSTPKSRPAELSLNQYLELYSLCNPSFFTPAEEDNGE